MEWFQIPCKVLLTPTIPFSAFVRWRLLRRLAITYKMCLVESWNDVWNEDDRWPEVPNGA